MLWYSFPVHDDIKINEDQLEQVNGTRFIYDEKTIDSTKDEKELNKLNKEYKINKELKDEKLISIKINNNDEKILKAVIWKKEI